MKYANLQSIVVLLTPIFIGLLHFAMFLLELDRTAFDLPRERLVVPLSVSPEERAHTDLPSLLIHKAAAAAPVIMLQQNLLNNQHVRSQHVILIQSVGGNPIQVIVYPLSCAWIRAINPKGAYHGEQLDTPFEPVLVFGVVEGERVHEELLHFDFRTEFLADLPFVDIGSVDLFRVHRIAVSVFS
jgi:hypothetical protein